MKGSMNCITFYMRASTARFASNQRGRFVPHCCLMFVADLNVLTGEMLLKSVKG